jgi:hypothetical protein
LGVLEEPLDGVIDAGELYCFPFFKDTRLYLQSNNKFKLLDLSKHPELIFEFIDLLEQHGKKREDCKQLAYKLNGHRDNFV